MDKLDILIFGAHADDAEIGMAGTIAKHTAAGLKVGICDLTFAELSSNGNVDRRRREAEEAAEVLGLAVRSNLGLPDRGLFLTPEHIAAVTEEIRKYSPRIVFAPYWEDRHPDHVACSRLVEEAVFNAKLRKYMPDKQDKPPVTVEDLFFYFINDWRNPDLVVEVTEQYETKLAALRCYRSQFEQEQGEDTVATPLNQGYVERVQSRDALLGQKKLIPFAEGFAVKAPYRINRFI
ncbi:bacillithiol biosynthesis deacetylase BshB1 [Paenibacillus physcomitrellae]|uniref:Bacillithiol biosynthesis deacetylase BshB1 n=1 Tax=Paenibacillus physcomitrellae TaxID=1619311 RepID=A0ABQ1FND4_9BACL|nr:bacillithiol biosynthesis deacetylase BshB1 [Paenibacillus physcomitrellae]GGA23276.1 bacillithiol biosynthesis deacetylase BshB1 [Paenibacillus physcomitrellae]